MSYAELHCLSNFSFLRGAAHGHELVRRAGELGYSALAITDECSLSGVVRAHEAAKEVGLKLIIGSEFRLADGLHLILLTPDHEAYTQLCQLITKGRRASTKGEYRLHRRDFEHGLERCLALWKPGSSICDDDARWLAALPFAGRYIAVEQHLHADSEDRLKHLLDLGERNSLPLVATGGVEYHVRDRRPLHDTMTAIRLRGTVSQIGRERRPNGERHLRPLETLRKLYPPALIQRTLEIAALCRFSLDELRYEYPKELVPAETNATEYLRALTYAGAQNRWPTGIPLSVCEQIEKELSLITELHYEHYFLTVADIVHYARSQGILCQGRGSAANSAVCYALGVTAIDPSRTKMLFERFISKERAEPPDIDIDFEHQRREEVIQYIYNKYGRERTALAATVICYRTRSAVRDVGKALGFSLDQVDRLSKSLLWREGRQAIPDRLRDLGFDPEAFIVRKMIELVNELIGTPRHLSQHVGGFVISHHPLSTLVPVENAAMPARTIIQWDKEDLETLGLMKVDCLALGMLSALRRCMEMLGKFKGEPFSLTDIPAEDEKTYDMLCRGESIGVFQVESRAQMSMLPRLKPRTYYDLVIQVAIVRPGPIQGGMVHPYLRRRQGLEKVNYPKEALKQVLDRTCGVPLFQEQVMQIAMVAADFSAGEADHVRRSMAAWQRRGGLEHFHERLISGMLKNGYEEEFAERIYQQILGFGSYGFPESHAASFALLAYDSAWLKCHWPAAFCASLLNSQPMGFYMPAQLVADARRNGVSFLPVDVQCSDWDCTLEPDQPGRPAMRIGMRLISGMPEKEALRVVAARKEGSFSSVAELAHRAQLSRKALSVLAEAHALRDLTAHRHAARWAALGVERLPGFLSGNSAAEPMQRLRAPNEGQDIIADYRSLGLTLGRHPLAVLRPRLNELKVQRSDELSRLPSGRHVRVAGLVTHRQMPETAAGVLFVSIEDEAGIANLIIWKSVQEQQRTQILGASLMVISGELQKEQGVIHIVARKVMDYSHWLGELPTSSRDFR
jgi:error-prone DNA polymerase